MQKRNWRQHNKDLVQQGSLSFFIDPKVFKAMHMVQRSRGPGRPREFSEALIQLLLMIKIRFRLPYRAVEGFAKSLFEEKTLNIPSYSLICKRVGDLKLSLPMLSSRKSVVIILDASGAKVCGEGEWKVKIHGRGRPRKWVKLHIAIDAESQEILAECTTGSNTADGSMTEKLCSMVPGKVKLVLADGAYDGKKSREAIRKRNAQALIPPPKNARYKGTSSERDQAIAVIRRLGGDKEAKSIWGKLSGYSRRVLVETAFSRMKRRFGDRLFSKSFKKQRIENTARCLLLNEMRTR